MRIKRIIKRHGKPAKKKRTYKKELREMGREECKAKREAFLRSVFFNLGYGGRDNFREEGLIRRVRSPLIRRSARRAR